jgi:hypothetical protein
VTVILFVPLVVIAIIVAVVLQRRHGRVEAVRFWRAIGLSLAVLFAVFAGLFIIGETAEDPGGATAVGLIATWLVPLGILAATAWWWPRVAGVVLSVLVAAVVAVGVWYAADPDWWRRFEDTRGPVRAVGVFALSLPLALLAWRRPMLGGGLLVTLGVLPGLLAVLSTGGGGASGAVAAASSPPALVGILFLISGSLEHRRPADSKRATGPGRPGAH